MAKYIGKRIVPKHGGVWDKTKDYENLVIVLDEATGGFLHKQKRRACRNTYNGYGVLGKERCV